MKEKKQKEIKQYLKVFSKQAASSFSPYFADQVMNRIEEEEKHQKNWIDFYISLKAVFRKVAVIAAIMLLVLISYNLKIGNAFSEEEMIYASEAVYNELESLPLFW
jgi:hypothetical protein